MKNCFMKIFLLLAPLANLFFGAWADVPKIINYQGKVEINTQPFSGPGYFKFAIVNQSAILWSNSAMSGEEPTKAILLTVHGGIFSIPLGDTSIPNMDAMDGTVFDHENTWLRVWFSKDDITFQKLGLDQKINSVAYAFNAARADTVGSSSDYSEQAFLPGDTSGTLGLFPRESVWPEHYGRGNTIKSYYVDAPSSVQYDVLNSYPDHTMPSDKIFIITDIATYGTGVYKIRTRPRLPIGFLDDKNCKDLLIYNVNGDSQLFSFNSGIPVSQNQRLNVRLLSGTGKFMFCGYEYSANYIAPDPTPTTPTSFEDNFNDGDLVTPPWIIDFGNVYDNIAVVGGELRLAYRQGTASATTLNAGGFENCRIEFEGKSFSSMYGTLNVYFRFNDTQYYQLRFYISSNDYWATLFSSKHNNGNDPLKQSIINFGGKHTIDVVNNVITYYLNDIEQFKYYDNDPVTGSSEVRLSGSGASEGNITIDNFVFMGK